MHLGRTTLSKFLIEQLKGIDGASDLAALLVDVAAAVKAISAMTRQGRARRLPRRARREQRPGRDAEEARRARQRDVHPRHANGAGTSPAWRRRSSTRRTRFPPEYRARPVPARVRPARRLVEHRRQRLGRHDLLGAAPCGRAEARRDARFPAARRGAGRGRLCDLRPGDDAGADGRARARTASRSTARSAKFILTHPNLRIPARDQRVRDQHLNARFWEPPVQRYVDECLAGASGDRAASDFNMRWIASMVAEVHRILMRGGVFMYPRDTKDPAKARPAAPAVRGQPDRAC